jgi:hypothetical protein
MPGRIFLKYDYSRGGLGDFVRGALATYTFCKERSIDFNFYIPEHPIRECFEYIDIKPQTSIELIYDVGDTNGAKLLECIFENNPSEEIILTTNAFEFVKENNLRASVSEFAKYFRPSDIVKERMAQIYKSLNVEPKNYVSLHVRCGDAFMCDYDRYCPGDARCEPSAALKDIEIAITEIRRETKLPILFHTDSEALRAAVQHLPVRPLESRIQHTAQHSENGCSADYYDSVAEFFIISQAAHVYYTVASGFPRWASVIGNVQFTYLKSPVQIS